MPLGNFLSTNQKHYQDLGSARHLYGISALVTQTSFCEGSSGDLAKRRQFSQASHFRVALCLSFSKRGQVHNLSYENEFCLHANENSFSYERLCTKTRLEKEVQENSETAYFATV